MALRLTGPSLRSNAAPDSAAIAARAAAALDAGDIDGYGSLFELAELHDDIHRRYRVGTALLEQGLAACGRSRAARARQIYLQVARQAVALLEREPCEPVILNFAGVALYELWSLDDAQQLFEAALRLDPSLPHAASNLAAVAARRQAVRAPGPRGLASLAPIEHAAREVTRRAQAPVGLRLSLCMIVRDEEEMLPRCLEAVAGAVDEIVIVDTGSQDATIEIARSFGAKVIEFPWTGSFAEARNVSFDAASGDWLMYLDADEVLVAQDIQKLRSLTGHTWREAFYLVETNFTGDLSDGTAVTHNAMRIFRNRPHYRFEGRLHEQIGMRLPGYLPERLEQTSVRVEHYGYLGAVRDAKEKSRRNIELLLAQQAESPPTAFLHFNLGSEYAAAGDGPAALAEFETAWQMIEVDNEQGVYEYVPSLIARLVKSLRVCGRPTDAIERARDGLARFPNFTDLVFEQATAAVALGLRAEAIAYYERCIELGDAPVRYTATVGCGTHLPRLALAELHLARGEVAEARELLEWCISNQPGFFGVVLPFASALLACGVAPEEVVSEVEARVDAATPTVRFMLGTALYEAGAGEAAERQYRLVLERQPHSAQARVALAEVLLYLRRYDEAASEAAMLPTDSPLAAMAIRTELFARIVAADFDALADARDRGLTVGLPAVEIELFDAWAGLAKGATKPPRLGFGALSLLGVMLEALLRVQQFDAFEKLVALLHASELPAREQHELLANVYARRGFAASAAEEWMAVCREQPDLRALLGLAGIARARGLDEDAAVFATQALALDPECAPARALLSPREPSLA
jgi:glycosyltransferase involved in cell wall biosynthesis/Flp pilus assembly protein TadD